MGGEGPPPNPSDWWTDPVDVITVHTVMGPGRVNSIGDGVTRPSQDPTGPTKGSGTSTGGGGGCTSRIGEGLITVQCIKDGIYGSAVPSFALSADQ